MGYRLPAQWEPHAATWMNWPDWAHREGQSSLGAAAWAELARAISRFEPLHILCGDAEATQRAEQVVGRHPNITIHQIPIRGAWLRDCGPTFLGHAMAYPPALVHWSHSPSTPQGASAETGGPMPERLAELAKRRRYQSDLIVPGGAIDSNGRGTALAVEAAILDPDRNPGRSAADVERTLAEYLGVGHVVWLNGNAARADTRVEHLARFLGPRIVAVAQQRDRSGPDYALLKANCARLKKAVDQDGRPLEVVPLWRPRLIEHGDARRPGGHLGFYVANGLVVVPQFDDAADWDAMELLSRCFPERQVRGMPAGGLLRLGGTAYRATLEEPAV